MPKICIVLATYNGEKYLSQMLDSLVMQTRPADLIIAVDDGSKDSTVKILQSFQSKLPLQINQNFQNQGHRAAFSKALEIAKGLLCEHDLIALADQDDIWLKDKLLLLEQSILSKDVPSLVFGDAEIIDSNGNVSCDSWRKLAGIQESVSIKTRIAGTNNVTGCLSIFHAKLLEWALPIPEEVGVHDAWIALLAAKAKGVFAIKDPVIQYRLHEGNAVGLKRLYNFDETAKRQIQWFTLLSKCTSISFSQEESYFVQKQLEYWTQRQNKALLIRFVPWLIKNRDDIFPSKKGQLKKILFSCLGAPAVHLIFGNKK